MPGLAIQYDFWETVEQSEIASLRKQMTEVKDSSNKVRKAMFARNGELTKRMLELEYRLENIERGLCQK